MLLGETFGSKLLGDVSKLLGEAYQAKLSSFFKKVSSNVVDSLSQKLRKFSFRSVHAS